MSKFMEEKILALSTFFLPHRNMSSKSAKKSTVSKNTSLFTKSVPKKEAPKKAVTKKHASSSDESSGLSSDDEPPKKSKRAEKPKKHVSSSESSSESEDEPPKKSKKKAKSKKKKVVSSSEESSSEEDDEIVLETIPAKESVVAPADKLNDGLLAIAAQFAESNANQTKILELLAGLFAKMETHNAEKEADDDLLTTIEDAVARGETIVIGSKEEDAVVHHFGSVGHLRQDSGQLATQTNFTKVISNLQEDEEVDISVGLA